MDFLQRMATASRERADALLRSASAQQLLEAALAAPAPSPLALERFDIIAEVKQRSPSAGALAATHFDLDTQVDTYTAAGAAAISVLTEPSAFDGSLDDLRKAAMRTPLPVMRKDFLVDPAQVFEARLAGASGVLLIFAILDDSQLNELMDAAQRCGLFVLLEAFNGEELSRARKVVGEYEESRLLVGVNCRDLTTLQIDFDRFAELAPELPEGVPCVAESGLLEAADAAAVASQGFRLALVGSALMQSPNPGAQLRAMLEQARAAAEYSGVH